MKTLWDKLTVGVVVVVAVLLIALFVLLDPLATEAPREIFR